MLIFVEALSGVFNTRAARDSLFLPTTKTLSFKCLIVSLAIVHLQFAFIQVYSEHKHFYLKKRNRINWNKVKKKDNFEEKLNNRLLSSKIISRKRLNETQVSWTERFRVFIREMNKAVWCCSWTTWRRECRRRSYIFYAAWYMGRHLRSFPPRGIIWYDKRSPCVNMNDDALLRYDLSSVFPNEETTSFSSFTFAREALLGVAPPKSLVDWYYTRSASHSSYCICLLLQKQKRLI